MKISLSINNIEQVLHDCRILLADLVQIYASEKIPWYYKGGGTKSFMQKYLDMLPVNTDANVIVEAEFMSSIDLLFWPGN